MYFIRIINDIHGYVDDYLQIAKSAPGHTLQIGDLNFNYDFMDQLDPTIHKFGQGNHDSHAILETNPPPHFIGRFGEFQLGDEPLRAMWIGGAYSVDKAYRTEWVNWWANEELSSNEANKCLKQYEEVKPNIVFSHDCPASVLPCFVTNNWKIQPSYTSRLLEQCFAIHAPRYWFFAHHHRNCRRLLGETEFICCNELCYVDLTIDGLSIIISETKGKPKSGCCIKNDLNYGRN